ncbi:MAG: ATP-dependent Clp protease ATP-binding subunit [Candidatus Andersenbacteria bacterium]|nr:ATP-dependent Clp protease ATP-binding subunit [Candidatus Andersenbacteria bacterium]
MEGLETMMTYSLKDSPRRQDVRNLQLLSSRLTVCLFIISFAITLAIVAFAYTLGITSAKLQGIGLIAGSAAVTLLLAFIYAVSFFPYRHQGKSPQQLLQSLSSQTINSVEASDMSLLMLLGQETEPHLILQRLLENRLVMSFCHRLGLEIPALSAAITQSVLPNLTLSQIAYHAANIAVHTGASTIGIPHAFGVFLLHANMQPYVRSQGLRQEDIHFAIWWQQALIELSREHRRWWTREKMGSYSGIGLSWAAGFTPLLDRFSYFPAGNLWDTAVNRQEEVQQLINTLARDQQSNVVLVGHPGVGRLGVVKEVARRIARQQAHPALRHQRVVYLHIGQLLSLGSSGPAQLQYMSRILDEMERSGNIIAVLDGLGSLLGGMGEGSLNVTDVLQPFFSSQSVRIAVIMSSEEYHTRLKNNDELLHLFEVVQIEPLLPEDTKALLAVTIPTWEKQEHMYVPYQALQAAVKLTAGIMPHIPFPEKAFDVLEEAAVKVRGEGRHAIEATDIEELITRKVGVPVGKVLKQEGERLLNLEDFIHRRVVNQEHGVAAVARAMIRARAGVRNESRPIGTFLFLGPTGVGKTETAKALAEAYFGDEAYLKRFDMSEFQTSDSLSRLIGDVAHPVGRLTSLIADHPFCVLLLDEFEKADLAVQQLFLQVFDEGRLTDAVGREYSFRHSIIISTSNAGAEFIRQHISSGGQVAGEFDNQLREHLLMTGIFRPELLNRFDGVVTFTSLSTDHIRQVARLMLKKLNKRLDASQGVTVAVTDELLDYLVSIGYNPEFGARPMARAIQDSVEYAVAQRALKGSLTPGEEIVLTPAGLSQTSN